MRAHLLLPALLGWMTVLATAQAAVVPLPGESMEWQKWVASSNSVVICRLAEGGFIEDDGPGISVYENARFDVTSVLKGRAPRRFVSTFRVHALPGKADAPIVSGAEYIATGNSVNGKFEVSELVVATPEDIQRVRQLTGHMALAQDTSSRQSSRPLLDLPGGPENLSMKLVPGGGSVKLPEARAILAQGTSPTVLWMVGMLMVVAFLLLLRLLMRSHRQRG